MSNQAPMGGQNHMIQKILDADSRNDFAGTKDAIYEYMEDNSDLSWVDCEKLLRDNSCKIHLVAVFKVLSPHLRLLKNNKVDEGSYEVTFLKSQRLLKEKIPNEEEQKLNLERLEQAGVISERIAVEGKYEIPESDMKNFTDRQKARARKACLLCGQDSHTDNKCPNQNNERNSITCIRCGSVGHSHRKCSSGDEHVVNSEDALKDKRGFSFTKMLRDNNNPQHDANSKSEFQGRDGSKRQESRWHDDNRNKEGGRNDRYAGSRYPRSDNTDMSYNRERSSNCDFKPFGAADRGERSDRSGNQRPNYKNDEWDEDDRQSQPNRRPYGEERRGPNNHEGREYGGNCVRNESNILPGGYRNMRDPSRYSGNNYSGRFDSDRPNNGNWGENHRPNNSYRGRCSKEDDANRYNRMNSTDQYSRQQKSKDYKEDKRNAADLDVSDNW